ncbi:MAG: hypothetical protein D6808_02950, partial [Candidatus Dadabacteria bacterium]
RGVGTFNYMAPEVLEGVEYREQADIYSLGVTFYELLSGKHPFEDASLIEQLKVRRPENLKSIGDLAPEIPEKLERAIMKCIAYDKKDRFRSFQELLDYLSGKKDITSVATQRKTVHPLKSISRVETSNTAQVDTKEIKTKGRLISQIEKEVVTDKKSGHPSEVAPPRDKTEPGEFTAQPSAASPIGHSSHKPSARLGIPSYSARNSSTAAQGLTYEENAIGQDEDNQMKTPKKSTEQATERPTSQPSEVNKVTKPDLLKPDAREVDHRDSSQQVTQSEQEPLEDKVNKILEDLIDSSDKKAYSPGEVKARKGPAHPPRFPLFKFLASIVLIATVFYFIKKDTSPKNSPKARVESSFIEETNHDLDVGKGKVENFGKKSFPFLEAGMYHGVISDLLPGITLPLVMISSPALNKITVIVGLEGWRPYEVYTSELKEGDPIRVASSGFVFSFTGKEIEKGEVVGFFTNILTGEEGEWRVQKVVR